MASLASSSKDVRIAAIVAALQPKIPEGDEITDEVAADPFKEVIKMIDDIIAELETEEGDDLKTKEQCEKERMENTQEAKKVAKEIDTNVETIDRLTAQIEAANKTIQAIAVEIQELGIEIRDAGDNRAKENKEYMAAESEDMAAVELIENAKGVLEKFYQESGLMLAQVRRVKQEPFVAAGDGRVLGRLPPVHGRH